MSSYGTGSIIHSCAATVHATATRLSTAHRGATVPPVRRGTAGQPPLGDSEVLLPLHSGAYAAWQRSCLELKARSQARNLLAPDKPTIQKAQEPRPEVDEIATADITNRPNSESASGRILKTWPDSMQPKYVACEYSCHVNPRGAGVSSRTRGAGRGGGISANSETKGRRNGRRQSRARNEKV